MANKFAIPHMYPEMKKKHVFERIVGLCITSGLGFQSLLGTQVLRYCYHRGDPVRESKWSLKGIRRGQLRYEEIVAFFLCKQIVLS